MNKAALFTILGSAILSATKSKMGSNSIEKALKVAGFKGGLIKVNLSVSYTPAIQYEDGLGYNNCYQYGERYNPSGDVEEKIIYFNFGSHLKEFLSGLESVDSVESTGYEQGIFDFEDIRDAYHASRYEEACDVRDNAINNNQNIADALEREGFYASAYSIRELNPQDLNDEEAIRECIFDGIYYEIDDEILNSFLCDFVRENDDNFKLSITFNPNKIDFSIDNMESNLTEMINAAMEGYNAKYKEESDDEDKDFQEGYIREINFDIEKASGSSELRRF
jgi:hypothetical protein